MDQANIIRELDDRHHLHPFTSPPELSAKGSRVITRAEGCYVYTNHNQQLLDGMAGLWCVNVGYGEERLVEAATRQMRELPYYNTFFQTTTPAVAQLGAKLAEITPAGIDRFHFVNSGSEVNDTIIKTVWYYWNLMGRPEKKHFISRSLGYHGVGVGSASLTGMPFMHKPFDLPLERFHHIGNPFWYAVGGDQDPEEFGKEAARWLDAKIRDLGPDNVAAFVAEPIQGAGGVIVPPSSYWPAVQQICREHDVLLVVDEVICGFGRTGNWFGCDTFAIEPDMIAMAKGLSSGYLPIAAAGFGKRIGEALAAEDQEYAHGVTYSGHPVAAAVALENITIIEERSLYNRASGPVGDYFAKRLQALSAHPLVGEVRLRGLMAAIELVEDKNNRRSYAQARKVGTICREHAIANGLIMRAVRDGMVLSPPLIITESQIDEMIAKITLALDATLADLAA